MADARFLVVTIHKNGLQRLKQFISSLLPQLTSSDQLVIVDNHSTDGSLEQIQEDFSGKGIQYICNPHNQGYATACNQGMQLNSSQFVIICNNDLILEKGTLDTIQVLFDKHPKIGMIGGQLQSETGQPVTSGVSHNTFLTEAGLKPITRWKQVIEDTHVPALVGAFMAVRRQVISDVGLMNENFFFYFEESDWCKRIIESGWEILLSHAIKLTHIGGATAKSYFLPAKIEYLRSQLLFWSIHFSKTEFYFLLILLWLKLILKSLLYGLGTMLTIGQHQRIKEKFIIHGYWLIWLIKRQPKNWGLPDKPPHLLN